MHDLTNLSFLEYSSASQSCLNIAGSVKRLQRNEAELLNVRFKKVFLSLSGHQAIIFTLKITHDLVCFSLLGHKSVDTCICFFVLIQSFRFIGCTRANKFYSQQTFKV